MKDLHIWLVLLAIAFLLASILMEVSTISDSLSRIERVLVAEREAK